MPTYRGKQYSAALRPGELEKLIALWKERGIELKRNKTGKINKHQFFDQVLRWRKAELDEEIERDKRDVSSFEGRVLTDEEMLGVQERLKSGELSKEAARKILLYKYKQDPLYMAQRLFREFTIDRSTDLPTPSPPFHRELLELYLKHNRVAIAAPRGHAKSTVTGFFYVMHQALFNFKRNIVIVSSTEDLAIRFLRDVKTEMEANRNLMWLFGNQRTSKWSEKEIQLANGTRIYAKGRGGQMRGLKERGTRPDLIICDDLEDSELVRSELRRLDLEDWFNGDVMPTLEPKVGQLIFIGTILHEDSLLNRVLNNDLYPDYTTRIYRAIQDDGKPLWPERFSLSYINDIKKSYLSRQQLSTFYMEYMNDPMPSEGATFRQEYFQYFEQLPENTTKELFIDLGGGSIKNTADDTAMVVLATDDAGNMYVDDYYAGKLGTDTDKIIAKLFKLADEHKVRKVYIEKTVASNMLVAAIERKMKVARRYLNIEYVSPTRGSGDRRGNMSDGKFQRIAAMEAPFKLGAIKIRRWMTDLLEQLLAFPRGKHDDLIDALAYGYMYGSRKRKGKAQRYVPKHRHAYVVR